jgi:hypothetical protein
MAIDAASPRTRRALLAAALGAGAAAVASALGRPLPVEAANGQAVTVGSDLTGTSFTRITNTANSNDVIWGRSSTGRGIVGTSSSGEAAYGRSPNGVGVRGISTGGFGVWGNSQGDGYGVYANSESGDGVRATGGDHGVYASGATAGVFGTSGAGPGIWGYHGAAGDGVRGESESGQGVTGLARSATTEVYGVYGNTVSPTGRAIFGRSTAEVGGTGAFGQADSPTGVGVRGLAWDGDAATGRYGTGVLGFAGVHAKASFPAARANTGVYGFSPAGTGVLARSTTGFALRAEGRVRLDGCSGLARIAAGQKSVVVVPGVNIIAQQPPTGSAVVATLQGPAGGTTTVHRVAMDPSMNTFTIWLTANATQDVIVAWHVFG